MTTYKTKRWSRRSRTTMCPSSTPQVVTEQPPSLRDDYSPSSNKSFSKVIEDLQEYENLTKVENLPFGHPRVKVIRERIESAMPFLNELSNKAPSSRRIVLHAEHVLSSHLIGDRTSCNPKKKSSNNPPSAAPHFATQGAQPIPHLKAVSPKSRALRAAGGPAATPDASALPPAPGNVVNTDAQVSPHQIAMLTAVHNALNTASREASCSWSEAPAAVSPEELMSLVDAPPSQHHPSGPPSGATHHFNPALAQGNVAMMQPQLPQSQQPNHALQYQSTAYHPMQPPKHATSAIHAMRGNGATEPAV